MELGNMEEKAIYEGCKILARTMAQAIVKEICASEVLSCRRDTNAASLQNTDDALKGKQERLVLSVAEAAKLLGLSRAVTYQAVRSGQIPKVRIGSRILIPRTALSRFLAEASRDKEISA